MSLLDTHTLRAFIAVADHQSFSKAAQTLHITQPAISKRVAQLEEQLGTPLFERLKKQVFLTEAGRTLLPRARSIVQSMSDAIRAVSDLDGQVSGELSIAFSHHIGLHRLPPYLKAYSKRFPDVRLNIDFVDSDQAYSKILSGNIELAVITLSPDPHEDILPTVLWRDPLAFMCSKDHALHLKNNVSLHELSEMNVILPGASTRTGRLVSEVFARDNLTLHSSMTTNYLETIKMMVSIGLGWSVLPKTMKESLEIIHVPDVYMERKLGTIEHEDRLLSNAAKAFKTILAQPPGG